jgi:riboflavin transporter FmnP
MEQEWIVNIAVIAVLVIGALILRRYVSKKRITVKQITFVGIMSAMGTALALASFVPIGPGINIDFSHIGTFIVAIALGPFYGMVTGALIGIYPMTVFGNPLVPVGKAVTGLVIGILVTRARLVIGVENKEKLRLLRIVPTAVVGWIPEAVIILVTLGFLGIPYFLPMPVVEGILVKGTGEIILLGILCEVLFASKALKYRLESLRDNQKLD